MPIGARTTADVGARLEGMALPSHSDARAGREVKAACTQRTSGLFEQPFNLTLILTSWRGSAASGCAGYPHPGAGLGRRFVKVTGEVGTGRDLLCRRLMAHLPASVVTACIFNQVLTCGLVAQVAQELGQMPADRDDEQALYGLIRSALQTSPPTVIVVCCIDGRTPWRPPATGGLAPAVEHRKRTSAS